MKNTNRIANDARTTRVLRSAQRWVKRRGAGRSSAEVKRVYAEAAAAIASLLRTSSHA